MTLKVTPGTGIQVFGNSFACPGTAAFGKTYADRLGDFVGGGTENRAIAGEGTKTTTQQGYAYHPYGSRAKPVTWDCMLNDICRYGTAAFPAIGPSLDAFLSSAFAGMARPASYPQVVKQGAWSPLGNLYGGKAYVFSGASAMYTTDINASLSLTFTADQIAVHSYLTENSAGGTLYQDLDIEIDGLPAGIFDIAGNALPGERYCGAAKVFRDLGPGSHTITVRPTVAGQYTVVDSFIVPITSGFAPVFISHIPFIKDWTNRATSNDPTAPNYGRTIAEQANAIIDQVVAEWVADGFPVAVMPANDYFEPNRDCGPDKIHPTSAGHYNLACGFISQMRF